MSSSVQPLPELLLIFHCWHAPHEIWWCLKLNLQVLFGDKMFSPHTFFEQFIATKVCNRKLFHRICSNFLFSFSGFDPKNLNMVRVSSWIWESNCVVAQWLGDVILNCTETCSRSVSHLLKCYRMVTVSLQSWESTYFSMRIWESFLLKLLINSCYWPKFHIGKLLTLITALVLKLTLLCMSPMVDLVK